MMRGMLSIARQLKKEIGGPIRGLLLKAAVVEPLDAPSTTSTKPAQRPVIGIPSERRWGSWAYRVAIRRAGGSSRLLTPNLVGNALDGIDGLLVPGGKDINPKFYGQKADPARHVTPGPEAFDRFELDLLRQALDREMPILGVCRGAQLLNVVKGGTLIQDIPTEPSRDQSGADRPEIPHKKGSHEIDLLPGSKVGGVLMARRALVNSLHHQAVAGVAPGCLGTGLIATAFAPDGIVEAIETRSMRYQVGVQFHPELSQHVPAFQRLFERLVGDAAAQ